VLTRTPAQQARGQTKPHTRRWSAVEKRQRKPGRPKWKEKRLFGKTLLIGAIVFLLVMMGVAAFAIYKYFDIAKTLPRWMSCTIAPRSLRPRASSTAMAISIMKSSIQMPANALLCRLNSYRLT
jgi:sterol desaturase/sphingolipid hydroxylase (fatty acid hydroxylase superfamily)